MSTNMNKLSLFIQLPPKLKSQKKKNMTKEER